MAGSMIYMRGILPHFFVSLNQHRGLHRRSTPNRTNHEYKERIIKLKFRFKLLYSRDRNQDYRYGHILVSVTSSSSVPLVLEIIIFFHFGIRKLKASALPGLSFILVKHNSVT
jgi:hypothetical protein